MVFKTTIIIGAVTIMICQFSTNTKSIYYICTLNNLLILLTHACTVYSGLILRGNFEVLWILLYPRNVNHESFQIDHCNGLFSYNPQKLSTKSFYYPIDENFPLKIYPLQGTYMNCNKLLKARHLLYIDLNLSTVSLSYKYI